MFMLYDFFIRLLIFGMKIGSLFNEKIRKGVIGRKETLKTVRETFSPSDEIIWMHAASLGEYEQGLPVLEKLKKKYPEKKILISFFSPSGYEHIKKRNHPADTLAYLPFDRKHDILKFCEGLNLVLFFTIKYDYWYRLFQYLKQQKVPIYVVSALFYRGQTLLKPSQKFFRKQLQKNVNLIFHQNEDSLHLATAAGLSQGIVSGDTRYDRVKDITKNFKELPYIQAFIKGQKTLVAGSSWEAEEQVVKQILKLNPNIKVILAPHDLKRIPAILEKLESPVVLYSQLSEENSGSDIPLLVIDNIGMLSRLYHEADVALVGGGFHSAGLHNILEAAVYGVPVIFGKHYQKNPEADGLIVHGGAGAFATPEEASSFILKLFSKEELRHQMAEKAGEFIQNQPDASEIIVVHLKLKDSNS